MSKESSWGVNIEATADIKALIVIVIISIGYFTATQFPELASDEYFSPAVDVPYFVLLALIGIMSIIVSRKYSGSEVFGKAYMFLGIGFFLWFVGDLIYYYIWYVLEDDPSPAWPDLFFNAYYVMAAMHLFINTRYFKRKWRPQSKAFLIIVPIIIMLSYTYLTLNSPLEEVEVGVKTGLEETELVFDSEESFNFYVGLASVAGTGVVFAFAIFGAAIFRHSVLGVVWLLLATGLFLNALADIIYYSLELTESWDPTHPVNTIWIGGFMLIVYALYRHLKAI